MHSRESLFLILSIPVYAVLIGTEIILSNWKGKGFYSLRTTLQNIYLTIMNAGLDLVLRWAFYVSILM